MRAVRGEQAYWTWDTELAAATFDAVQRLGYYILAVNGVKEAKAPDPFPRPGTGEAAPRPKPTATLAGFTQFLQEGDARVL